MSQVQVYAYMGKKPRIQNTVSVELCETCESSINGVENPFSW